MVVVRALVLSTLAVSAVSAQIFRRTAACPNLGCVFPPDQADFFAGQAFDIRLEIQAPLNGSEAFNNGVPIVDGYTFKIGGRGGEMVDATQFFGIEEPDNEPYNFTYYEDLVSQDAKNTTLVNVVAKSFRNIALYNPGLYDVEFTYNGGQVTRATWEVRELATCRKAKNVILFVGDGMTQSMITAARLLAHKTIGGKYMSKMTMDMAPAIGLQMTHSLDSFITDSANSASALMGGKKSTVNALNAYQDSTGKPFGDPKYETIFEAFRRVYGGQVGAVSTAFIADATPAATVAHTSQRSQYTAIIEQYLNGVTANYSWFDWQGIDVLFGAGAENFLPGPGNGNVSQFERWQDHGYSLSLNKTELDAIPNDQRALGLFCQANLPTWLDRNVYKNVLDSAKLPRGGQGTYDLPSLTDMTLKAIDILSTRSKNNGDTGFMLMSEAASIDKQMHSLDYHRSLGELLELDATVNATLRHLEEIGELDNTLVVVTADHGHGFDVFGTADTEYLRAQEDDREKRNAIGTYENSGLSAYQVPPGVNPQNDTIFVGEQGANFPVNWDPRYVIAAGTAAFPDHKEDYSVNKTAPRTPAVKGDANTTDGGYFYNPADAPKGLYLTGNLPGSAAQGVHSLTDVPIFAWGPGHELFRGVLNSPDVALTLAIALDLGRTSNITSDSYKR